MKNSEIPSPTYFCVAVSQYIVIPVRPFPVLLKVCSFWRFLGPQKSFSSYIPKKCVPFGKKEHVLLFQKPLSQNPPVPILGEVPFIVLRPVFIFCYFGG
jgi:hypothetical protein